MMCFKKRSVTFGNYNTADYGWTLTYWKLSDPEQKTYYVEKPGGDGSLDLSTVITDGVPSYKDRTITAKLECSNGTRDEREELIGHLVNLLDGMEVKIIPPDHPNHYLVGRLHVAEDHNNLAYAAVTVTGTVRPWLYRRAETVVELVHSLAYPSIHTLRNSGRLTVVPTITVADDAEDVGLAFGNTYTYFGPGVYKWPELILTPGNHELRFAGKGHVTITYREAVLR